MTVWVGLTGGIGSGKSQVSAMFSELAVPVIDADAISRSLTAEQGKALPEIRRQFGDTVFCGNTLNRQAMRDLVFRQPEYKELLESILYPLIYQEIYSQQQKNSQAVYGIVDIPLLAEKPLFRRLVSRILVVDCAEKIQIQRVQERNRLPEADIKRILSTQANRADRQAIADDILMNEGTIAELHHKVVRLHRFYQAVFSF